MTRTNDLRLRFPNASFSFLKLHGLGDAEPAKAPDTYALSKDPYEVPNPAQPALAPFLALPRARASKPCSSGGRPNVPPGPFRNAC